MAGKVGMVVNYQPTADQAVNFNSNNQQMAAVITSWNEESEKAGLAVFVPGANYLVALGGIVEGVDDGEFQQSTVESNTAKATKAAKEAQAKLDAELAKKQQQENAAAAKATPVHASR